MLTALHIEARFFDVLSFVLFSCVLFWIYLLQIGQQEGMFLGRSSILKRSDEPGDGFIL